MSPTEKPLNALLFFNRVSMGSTFRLRQTLHRLPCHARLTPALRASLFPREGQRTSEERGETLGLLSCGAANPGRRSRERLNDNFKSAAFDLLPPRALHTAVDEQDWRDPALWPIDAAAFSGKQLLRVTRRADDVLIETRQKAR